MLIINDTRRLLAGVVSLNEPCPYCSQRLRAYQLIMREQSPSLLFSQCACQRVTSDCASTRDRYCGS